MSDFSHEQQSALLDLLDALREETITADERTRLQALVASHEEARKLYCEYMFLASTLHWTHSSTSGAATPDESSSCDHPIVPSSHRPTVLGRATSVMRRPVYWSVLAAGVLFAAYFVTVSWNMLGKKLPNGTDGNVLAVAMISDTQDAQWSAAQESEIPGTPWVPKSEIGSAINQGESLQIDSGLVELQLRQGTTLLIEGPAEWSISGVNNAMLKRGKLIARVPEQAKGFMVETPTARIVDLGTEFGVEVAGDGASDVHVLQGLITVQPARSYNQITPSRVQAGQSVQVTGTAVNVTNRVEVPEKFQLLAKASAAKRSGITRLIDLSSAVVNQSSGLAAGKYPAKSAIDGKLGTFSHTDTPDTSPWWQIDLGSPHTIAAVVLTNRQDSSQARLRDIKVQVLGEDGKTILAESPLLNPKNAEWGGVANPKSGPTQLTFDLQTLTGKVAIGRYVRVTRLPDVDDYSTFPGIQTYLTLAEVQVFETADSQPAASSPPPSK